MEDDSSIDAEQKKIQDLCFDLVKRDLFFRQYRQRCLRYEREDHQDRQCQTELSLLHVTVIPFQYIYCCNSIIFLYVLQYGIPDWRIQYFSGLSGYGCVDAFEPHSGFTQVIF